MRISLLTVPVEADYSDLQPTANAGVDVFVSSRAVGSLPIMPKIAIVSLLKWMKREGFDEKEVDYYDADMLLPSDEELDAYFRRCQPEIVGLSAVVSTCYAQVKRISSILRMACPDAWIIMGGSLSAAANLVLHKTDVDICVVGDGEIAWVEFLRYAEKNGRQFVYSELDNIAGLAYLDGKNILKFSGYGKSIPGELNPFPDYEILASGLKSRPKEFDNYFRKGLGSPYFQVDKRSHEPHRRPMLAQMWTSKGCVARCTFCQRSTKGYRVLGQESLDEHLQELASKFDVGYVHILDENFGSDREYAYEVARTMQKHDMLWIASGVRVTSVEYEDIKFFKEHGCVSLKFGVESGSQKILDLMEKKFTVERVYSTLKHCADLDLYSPMAVMVGMPGESLQTAEETGKFLGKMSYMQGVSPVYLGIAIFYALPLCGTPLYVYGQQVGVIGDTPEEEEVYLLSVSGSGATKYNYVNLNGSKVKDIVWWDWLVRFEAQRTYAELVAANGAPKQGYLQESIVAIEKEKRPGQVLSFGELFQQLRKGDFWSLKPKLFFFMDAFMEYVVIPSKPVSWLPRWIVYPFFNSVVYLQYFVQRVILLVLGRSFNLWKTWTPAKVNVEGSIGKVTIQNSLRKIVAINQVKGESKSPEKKSHEALSIGL